ncbi:MAG TPA: vWA domain-containing protein, partial [Thermoanaerobaculia bacterium]
MPSHIQLDAPIFLWVGIPAVVLLLALLAWAERRRGVAGRRIALLAACRALALLPLVGLLARPVGESHEEAQGRRSIALLVDRSRSMSLVEGGESRHRRALALAEKLQPALAARGYTVRPFTFAEDAVPAVAAHLGETPPDGRRSNLGGAIARAVRAADPPPLAVVALTDGAANEEQENGSALLALREAAAPFVGVGIGADRGLATLSLEKLQAPPTVPPKQRFRVSALLQAVGAQEVPAFDLLLLRDGRLQETRTLHAFAAPRLWSESFEVSEDAPGVHEYTVELAPPSLPDRLVTLTRKRALPVVVAAERDLRILFVQGALTWDFKFIGRALRGDPSVHLTGLSRTSQQSIFRQNVESAGELSEGFP